MNRGFESAGCRLAKSANGGVAHGLSHLTQRADLFGHGTERAAARETLERLMLANCADAAGHALAAAFLAEEGGDPKEDVLEVDGVVKQHHHAGAERGTNGAGAFECERRVEFGGGDESARGATQQHGLKPPAA